MVVTIVNVAIVATVGIAVVVAIDARVRISA